MLLLRILETGNIVFTLCGRVGLADPEKALPGRYCADLPAAREGEVDGKRYVKVTVHECLER